MIRLVDIYESIVEDIDDAKYSFDILVPAIEDRLDIKVLDHLGHDTSSDVFTLTDDSKVLKIMTDECDGAGLYYASLHPELPFVKVYELHKISLNKLPRDMYDQIKPHMGNYKWIYIAINEKLKTGNVTVDQIDDLEEFFIDYGLGDIDVRWANVGWNGEGKLVMLDPNMCRYTSVLGKVKELDLFGNFDET